MKCWSQLPAANQKKPTHPAEQSRLTILRRWWVTFLWVELIYEWYQSADYSSTQGGDNSSQTPRIEVLKSVVVQRWSFSWPPLSSWWQHQQIEQCIACLVEHFHLWKLFWLLNCCDCWNGEIYTWGGNHSICLGISICTVPQCNLFSVRQREDWTLHFIDPYWVAACNSLVPLCRIAQLLNAGDLAVFLHYDWYFVCAHQYVDWSGADLVLSQPNQMHSRCQAHQYIY